MKKRLTALLLCLALPLSGCASLLERSYASSTVHVDKPTTAEDPSVLRVVNYRELVWAVLYLVSQGVQEGVIQLHDYSGNVETDLSAACAEVAAQDPLGAYAVDYIQHEYTRVVSYYQATLSIHYRRTQEQVHSIVNATGAGAIRAQLREALSKFSPEVVLRVAYFAEDEDSIAQLIRQAYYDTPATALGMPAAQIQLYPDSGKDRVVEILLTYPESTESLQRKSGALAQALRQFPPAAATDPEQAALEYAQALLERAEYDPAGGESAYDALVEGSAGAAGLALAYELICRQGGLSCRIIEGSVEDHSRVWTELAGPEEALYWDGAAGQAVLFTAQELLELGYRWEDAPEPEESPQSVLQAELSLPTSPLH